MLVHNNAFLYNDWVGHGNLGTVMDKSKYGEVSQNSFLFNGVAHGLRYTGRRSTISDNYFVGQCWGLIQSDGASIQVSPSGQNEISISNNWIHDSPKKGIRFDGNGDPLGLNGFICFNVVWNIIGNLEIFAKGDNHTVVNNVAWDELNPGDSCNVCVPSSHSGNPMNFNSMVKNNAAMKMLDGGSVIENNYASRDMTDQMIDVLNMDFRPRIGGAFDQEDMIGAYVKNDSRYWIPGRKLFKTSNPIPKDGATILAASNRNDVICQTAFKGLNSEMYHL